MLVALRNTAALHHLFGAFFHPAFAGYGNITGALFAGDQFKTGSPAVWAIFPGHVLPLEQADWR
jgi:hypothetical protein